MRSTVGPGRGRTERTLYVVAYDIPDDKRRTKVHKTLEGFGRWTQYSLFECYLSDKEMVILRGRLDGLLKPSEDSVRFYPLCAGCEGRVETIGSEKPREETVFLI
ncbi:MAG: CRISPR-associated endonuclease Cas2 [Anaerolineae bacterium]|nr:CRISPR-associated endonuclease Cas2 [Anaerolineae bacterium]